ncbi:MAG: CRTAC1 family protein [Acidobacteriota bacterium]|nr:CRTAC1 family protein [Acidobacteriota bacterium]
MRRLAVALIATMTILELGCPAGIDDVDDGVAETAPPVYVDRARDAGLTHPVIVGDAVKNHLLETTGTGVAVGDYDNDGDEDLYVVTAQSSSGWLANRRSEHNRLYRNRGDGTYDEVADEAGVALATWGQGAYFVDIDDDGDLDLFVTNWGPNVFYRNSGDGTFVDETLELGVSGAPDAWSAGATFSDLDGDGDLDLYVANYCEFDLANPPHGGSRIVWKGIAVFRGPHGLVAQPDTLYRNDSGRFTDISRLAGIASDAAPRYGLGVVAADFDEDGDQDIYVANDSQSNYLWMNEGGLNFTDVATRSGVATNGDAKEQAGMGTDAADYNGDGRLDLVVTNFSHDWNTLYRNEGQMLFRDDTFPAGLQDSYLNLVWGVKFFDANDDRRLDLFVANGHIYPAVDSHAQLNTSFRQPNTLYLNSGDGTFRNVSNESGSGMAVRESSRGVAITDAEGDGDLDLVVTNMDQIPTLLIRTEGGSGAGFSLDLDLRSSGPNRYAVAARVQVTTPDGVDRHRVNPFNSYLSQSRYPIHVGLGANRLADRVEISWPSGAVENLEAVAAGARYRIVEGQGIVERIPYRGEGS